MKKYIIEELSEFLGNFPFKNSINGKTFFITGATGFLGSYFTLSLLELRKKFDLNIGIVCQIRDLDKAKSLFGEENIEYIICSLKDDFIMPSGIDYVLHCASPTDSKYFITNPVETFTENIDFTKKLIDKCLHNGVSSFLYLSSLEVYGVSETERVVKENSVCNYSLLSVRNSYPLSKIATEELLFMYYKEYGLPVKIARLSQTFGAGIRYGDNRVFAQFAKCATEHKNIVLKSKGETKRNYCYGVDAVSALFYILFNGKNGEAYNIANDKTYISIYELAELFCKYADNINIEFQIEENEKTGYLPVNKINLDNTKLKSLGWKSHYDIERMVDKFCRYFKNIR